jgi:biopolymer transport protein ExbD/biopolymer transport protein TolR
VRQRKPFKPDNDVDMTPMIDVTFLLLIFFMVTSKMQDQSKLALPPAKNGLGVNAKESVVISLYRSEGEPEIYVTARRNVMGITTNTELGPLTMAELTEHVREEVQLGRKTIVIKADRDLLSGTVEEVARAAGEADPNLGTDDGLKFFVGVMDKPQ